MRYLAWRSETTSGKAGTGGQLDALADAILSTNPLLESFGNAKTVRAISRDLPPSPAISSSRPTRC